jgi:uncharacterized protein (TIGR02001 family)
MRFSRSLWALSLIAVFGAAHAEVTATLTGASDFDFRGISQNAHKPTPQGSVDLASDSGWYLGAWGSRIDLGARSPGLEVDFSGGFRKKLSVDGSYELGSVYYTYHAPNADEFDYVEVYTGATFRWAAARLYFSPKFGGNAGREMLHGDVSAFYLTTEVAYPLRANLSFTAHAGYSFGNYWDKQRDGNYGRPYFDWSAGLGYTHRRLTFMLKWIDGSALAESNSTMRGVLSTRAHAVFAVSTTFP